MTMNSFDREVVRARICNGYYDTPEAIDEAVGAMLAEIAPSPDTETETPRRP